MQYNVCYQGIAVGEWVEQGGKASRISSVNNNNSNPLAENFLISDDDNE